MEMHQLLKVGVEEDVGCVLAKNYLTLVGSQRRAKFGFGITWLHENGYFRGVINTEVFHALGAKAR